MARSAELRRHFERVAALGCLISGRPNPTLHHVHGGSCVAAGIHKGFGQKTSDWLVIPLAMEYHTGAFGVDSGAFSVKAWEDRFGSQIDHLVAVSRKLGYNVFLKAGVPYEIAGL